MSKIISTPIATTRFNQPSVQIGNLIIVCQLHNSTAGSPMGNFLPGSEVVLETVQWRDFDSARAELLRKAFSLSVEAADAEANDEISRPLNVQEFYLPRFGGSRNTGEMNSWARRTPEIEKSADADAAEFVWSKSLYRARKAAQEFGKETHADY